jgi:hypothetical protein
LIHQWHRKPSSICIAPIGARRPSLRSGARRPSVRSTAHNARCVSNHDPVAQTGGDRAHAQRGVSIRFTRYTLGGREQCLSLAAIALARPWPRPVIERVGGAICDPKRVRMATVVGGDSRSQRGLKTQVRNQIVPKHNISRNPCLSVVRKRENKRPTPSRPRALGRAWRRTLQGDPNRLKTGRRDPPRASTAVAPAACADPSSGRAAALSMSGVPAHRGRGAGLMPARASGELSANIWAQIVAVGRRR